LLKRFSKFFGQDNHPEIDEKTVETSSAPPDKSFRSLEGNKMSVLARMFGTESIDMDKLRQAVWSGCPSETPGIRVKAWKILLGILPTRLDRHQEVQLKKARDYELLVRENERNLVTDVNLLSDTTARAIVHQIEIDIPRTANCGCDLITISPLSSLIRRMLIIWSLRNPACGYVQGMNDITVPLLIAIIEGASERPCEQISVDDIGRLDLSVIESDLYWMFSRIIQGVQDHYTSSQPGIQKMMKHFRDLVKRVDNGELLDYLDSQQVDLTQLSFRWFNCLLVRELDYQALVRVWDTCIAEEDGFSVFMVYFCTAWIKGQTEQLKRMDCQQIMEFFGGSCIAFAIQDTKRAEVMLAEAFVLKSLFHSSPNHLSS